MPISMIFTLPLLASGKSLRVTLDEGPRSREDKQMPIPMIFTLPLLASGKALRVTLEEGPSSRDQ
jgi:hypothetical protein